MYRDIMCGEISSSNEEQKINLAGWVSKRRDHGQLIFIDLRDKSGIMQIVFNPEISDITHANAKNLRSEWVISVTGIVKKRLEGAGFSIFLDKRVGSKQTSVFAGPYIKKADAERDRKRISELENLSCVVEEKR